MKRKFKSWLAAIGLTMVTGMLTAQVATQDQVRVEIDTTRILIGDQVNIRIQLEQDANKTYLFPIAQHDTLVTNVEILDVSPVDTQILASNRLLLSQRYLITSFDTGFYIIPSFIFQLENEKEGLKSQALPLEVLTLEIDTTKGITDIKLPYDVPITFREVLPYIIVGLLLLLILYFVWRQWKKRKNKPVEEPIRKIPPEPAHIWALRELDKVAQEKIWQKGKIKLFHSKVSEIIRSYIEFRFEVRAMEQTTAEIRSAFEKNGYLEDDILETLYQTLELSDLVKFAKWNPTPDENERTMENAYEFVLKTKKQVNLRQASEEDEKKEVDNE